MAVYLRSLTNDFVFDDRGLTVENPMVIHPSWNIFLSYRPLRNISYAFDYWVFGAGPAGFRFMNIVYHALMVVLVFLFVSILSRKTVAALVAAALYAIHPVQTDAVAYISGRRDILAALFGVGALILFIRFLQSRKWWLLFLSIISVVLSLLSKENGVVVPLLMLVLLFLDKGDHVSPKKKILIFAVFLILFVLGVSFAILKGGSPLISEGKVLFHGNNPKTHYITALTLFPYYLKQTLFPFQLILDNANYPLVSHFNFKVFCAAMAILLYLSLMALLWYKGYRRLTFYLLFFGVALTPMLQIVPLHEIAADHYLYLPLVGFCSFVGEVGVAAWRNLSLKRYTIPATVVVLVLLGAYPWYAYRTTTRINELENIYTALAVDSKWRPLSFRGLYTVGAFFLENGFPDIAYRYYDAAWRTGYYDSSLLGNIVLYHIVKGEHEKAISFYEECNRRGEPVSLPAFAEMAVIYAIAGDCTKARETFARLSPSYGKEALPHWEVVNACNGWQAVSTEEKITFLKKRGLVVETRPLYMSLFTTGKEEFSLRQDYLKILAQYDVPAAFRFMEKFPEEKGNGIAPLLREKRSVVTRFCEWFSGASGNGICIKKTDWR